MRISGNITSQPNYVVVIAGEHMQTIAADGWTKADIRTFVFEHTQNSIAHLKRTERMAGAIEPDDETARRPIVAPPGRHPRGRGGRARRRLFRVYPRLGQPPHQRGRDEAHQRQEGMMARLEILDPTVEARKQPLTYVARPDSLQGKRIGLVENTKFNSDRLLLKIGEILKRTMAPRRRAMWRKHNAGVPAHKEILDEARRTVDVVVAGIGD